jgi:hypothetical protein
MTPLHDFKQPHILSQEYFKLMFTQSDQIWNKIFCDNKVEELQFNAVDLIAGWN